MDDKETKELIKEGGVVADKFNEFFGFLFTMQYEELIPTPELLFLGRVSEEWRQIDMTRQEVLGLLKKLHMNKSSYPDGVHP